MVLYTYSRKVLYMESREERYSNNLSRQSKNKDLYNQVYGLEDNLDNLPLSKNEIYITKMQTEINTRDEYRKSRGDKTLSETTPQVKEESIPIQEVEKNVYDINKVLDKVKADNEKKNQPEQPTPKEDYLKKLNIDNIDEVKEMYDDIISSVDEETENRLQKTANLSLEILSDLKGDNEETMITAPIIEDELPEIEKTKKMNFYTGNCKFTKSDFESNDEEEDDGEWDDYHQYHCSEITPCYRNGREIWVDSDNLDDFVWIESKGAYHHEENCICCDECQTNILVDDAMCSEITEEYYCCKECMEKAEDEFKRKNWYYSEYDEAWYEELDDITRIHIWNESEGVYEEKSICIDTLDGLIENEDVWQLGEGVFDKVNPSTNLPYGYELKKEMNHEYAIIEEAV